MYVCLRTFFARRRRLYLLALLLHTAKINKQTYDMMSFIFYSSRFFFDFEFVECETHKNERDRDREEQRELLFGIITIFR